MKSVYKITLHRYANILCNDIAVMAAKSNGQGEAIEFTKIIQYFEEQKKLYPAMNKYYSIGNITNRLTIVVKIGGTYERCLILERVYDWSGEDEDVLKEAINKPNKKEIKFFMDYFNNLLN